MIGATLMLALLGASPMPLDEPPPNHPDIPKLPSQLWAIDNQGNARIELELEVVRPPVRLRILERYCTNTCLGGKHLLHAQCDDSCDERCGETHWENVRAEMWPRGLDDLRAWRLLQGTIDEGLNQFGCLDIAKPLKRSIKAKIAETLGFTEQGSPWDYEWHERHWTSAHCATQGRGIRLFVYEIKAKWNIHRYDTAPDGRQIKVQGPQGESIVAEIQVPDQQSLLYRVWVTCRCSIVQDELEETGYVPAPEIQRFGEAEETGVCMGEEKRAPQATPALLASADFNVVCEDMNNCTVSATNPTDDPLTFVVHPGTLLASADPKVQDMAVASRIVLTMAPRSSASVSVPMSRGPFDSFSWTTAATGRVLCLNMFKREPGPGDKFSVALPKSSVVNQLAHFTAKQRIRGPWDQVRMWIVTDKAPLSKMSEVLIPGPTPGRYLDAMYEAHTNTAADLTSDEYSAVWEPRLISGASADPDALEWFVLHMSQTDPNGLAAWVKSSLGEFRKNFDADAQDFEKAFAALVPRLLGASEQKPLRGAAVAYLMGVPASSRASVAALGGLSGLGWWLTTSDADAAAEALTVLEAYKTPDTVFWLANVSPQLPEAIRSRAAKALIEGIGQSSLRLKNVIPPLLAVEGTGPANLHIAIHLHHSTSIPQASSRSTTSNPTQYRTN